MSETSHQINLALRTASGHARAANDALAAAEGTYEMKMKSAGASVWEAWALAVRSQPEYKGRKLDDRALLRIYESTKARPWWDRHLSAVRVSGQPATREWAKRTLQWHTDPNAARARRAKDAALSAAKYRKVKELKEKAAARGSQRPQAEPTTAKMKEAVHGAGNGWTPQETREYDAGDPGPEYDFPGDDLEQLLERVRKAVQGITDAKQLTEAAAILRLTVEGLEAL